VARFRFIFARTATQILFLASYPRETRLVSVFRDNLCANRIVPREFAMSNETTAQKGARREIVRLIPRVHAVLRSTVLLLVFWFPADRVAVAQTSWKCERQPIEPCVRRHGRLSSQNGIAHKLWLIGTHRMVAVENSSMPLVVEKYLEITSDDHSYIFGDFDICPTSPDVPGHIMSACIAGAEKLVVQPLRKPELPFRLLPTWPADARRQ